MRRIPYISFQCSHLHMTLTGVWMFHPKSNVSVHPISFQKFWYHDVEVREITQDNQFLGQRLVQGMLAAEGIKVQRQRVADSLIRVDEAAVAMRWCRAIHRRVYQVAGPNALWHIDGNHKIIRYLQFLINISLVCIDCLVDK